jgi:hypothetical protein
MSSAAKASVPASRAQYWLTGSAPVGVLAASVLSSLQPVSGTAGDVLAIGCCSSWPWSVQEGVMRLGASPNVAKIASSWKTVLWLIPLAVTVRTCKVCSWYFVPTRL